MGKINLDTPEFAAVIKSAADSLGVSEKEMRSAIERIMSYSPEELSKMVREYATSEQTRESYSDYYDDHIYDAEGNRFYSSYGSLEQANEAIQRLAEEGITAKIGPNVSIKGAQLAAPCVSLYIVPEPVKKSGRRR